MYYLPHTLGKQRLNPAAVGNPVGTGEHPVKQDFWCYFTQKKPPPRVSTVLTQQELPQRSPGDQIPA